MDKVIGLSLSFCVADIARGKVDLEQVVKIVANTAAATPAEWGKLITSYKKTYWQDFPEKCGLIVKKLLNEGKIEQPRLEGKGIHNIAKGHWMRNGTQIRL